MSAKKVDIFGTHWESITTFNIFFLAILGVTSYKNLFIRDILNLSFFAVCKIRTNALYGGGGILLSKVKQNYLVFDAISLNNILPRRNILDKANICRAKCLYHSQARL